MYTLHVLPQCGLRSRKAQCSRAAAHVLCRRVYVCHHDLLVAACSTVYTRHSMHALLAEYSDDSDSDDGAEELPSTATTVTGPAGDPNVVCSQPASSHARKRSKPSPTASTAAVQPTTSKKSRVLPPPPLQLLIAPTATASSATPNDSSATVSSQSDGRIRAFPHVDGNWSTHVYIVVPASVALNELMDECDRLLPASLLFHRQPSSELHLSLSRCVVLRHHHIARFTELLTSAVSGVQLPCVPLPVVLTSLALYCNEQRTRSFAAMRVGAGEDELLRVLAAVDGALAEMGLQVFYEQPELHVSYAWRLGDVWKDRSLSGDSQQQRGEDNQAKDEAAALANADETTSASSTSARDTSLDRSTVAACLVEVSAVHCKVGNRLTVIPLTAK